MKYKVTNINTNGKHYLIHLFYKDLTSRDVHAYNEEMLNDKITEFLNDENHYDFYVFKAIDFDLKSQHSCVIEKEALTNE